MMRVRFENFRCFTSSPMVEIRPLALLIGENSAGKTSFLAGMRFLFESMSGTARDVFNRDPYYLGGFQEIAYSRIRGRPASSFVMQIELTAEEVCHQFRFVRGEPQPELSSYEFSSAGDRMVAEFMSREPSISLHLKDVPEGDRNITISNAERSLPPLSYIKNNPTYLFMMFDYVMYRSEVTKGRRAKAGVSAAVADRMRLLKERFRVSTTYLNKSVFASAPVRTQPHRTYTPSEVAVSSEGDQVPLELARAKLRSPERWSEVQKGLSAFGRDSGLFTNVDVRQFGKSDIDPFQVLVRVGSARRNLVGVGYGVSQILPIVFQLQNPGSNNVFLLQQPEVHLHPRAQAELGSLIADKHQQSPEHIYIVETHSDYIIDRLRILISMGILNPDHVGLVFFQKRGHDCIGSNIYFNRRGELLDVPDNFRSFFIEEHSRLLGF